MYIQMGQQLFAVLMGKSFSVRNYKVIKKSSREINMELIKQIDNFGRAVIAWAWI